VGTWDSLFILCTVVDTRKFRRYFQSIVIRTTESIEIIKMMCGEVVCNRRPKMRCEYLYRGKPRHLQSGIAALDLCKVCSPVGEGGEIDRWVEKPNWSLFAEVAVVEIV
jgi:hypothetical protein